MLFRTCELLVCRRTQTINALWGHRAEFGLVGPADPRRRRILGRDAVRVPSYRQTFTDRSVALINQLVQFSFLRLHLARVGEVVQAELESPGVVVELPATVRGGIAARGLSFRYGSGDRLVLDGGGLDIEPGSFVAFTGPDMRKVAARGNGGEGARGHRENADAVPVRRRRHGNGLSGGQRQRVLLGNNDGFCETMQNAEAIGMGVALAGIFVSAIGNPAGPAVAALGLGKAWECRCCDHRHDRDRLLTWNDGQK